MEAVSFASITKLKTTMLDGGSPQDTGASDDSVQAQDKAARLFSPEE